MGKLARVRHLRHRRLDISRGAGATKRLRHTKAWYDRISTDLTGTAAAQAVTANNATNNFTLSAHGYQPGEMVQLGGTAAPTGLSLATDYYVIAEAENTFQLAESYGNAIKGVALTFSDDGTTVTCTRQTDTDALIALSRSGVRPEQLEASTDIDTIE